MNELFAAAAATECCQCHRSDRMTIGPPGLAICVECYQAMQEEPEGPYVDRVELDALEVLFIMEGALDLACAACNSRMEAW